jgi:hypothetical protein
MPDAPADDLRYLEPARVKIRDRRCDGMTIRAATGQAIGRLQGFLVDPVARRLKYLVVRTGLFGPPRMLPVEAARVDLESRAIELAIDDHELRGSRPFAARQFQPFSDDDLIAALFSTRRPA